MTRAHVTEYMQMNSDERNVVEKPPNDVYNDLGYIHSTFHDCSASVPDVDSPADVSPH